MNSQTGNGSRGDISNKGKAIANPHDSDDDLAIGYDFDARQERHGTRNFNAFLDKLDWLKVNGINELLTLQWDCPACVNGPGTIEWYQGLQQLMTHAKMKGATPVDLHRELATILEEELKHTGTPNINAEGQSSEGSNNNILLRILVPSCKVGLVIGAGGNVLRNICRVNNCTLRIVHRFEEESTAIILGKAQSKLKVPPAVGALCRVHRISTYEGQHRTAATNMIISRMLARTQHLTDFSGIAEQCHAQIVIKEDVRMSALPGDCIIEVSGEMHGVRKAISLLSQHLCRFLFDDSVVDLFFIEPKTCFRSISPAVESWYFRLPMAVHCMAEATVDGINCGTEIVGVVHYEKEGFILVELIGKRVAMRDAIGIFKRSMGII